MKRTIRLRLSPKDCQALSHTARLFAEAFNLVCRVGWETGGKNGVRLHRATYSGAKAACRGLVSDLLIQARARAAEALRLAFDRRRKGRAFSCPPATACPPRSNHHTPTIGWAAAKVRLSTVGGCETVPFTTPEHYRKYAGGRTPTGDLVGREGKRFPHVSVELPDPTAPAPVGSARRHPRRPAGKANRLRRACDHVLSRRIVDSVGPGTGIVVEKLAHIRSRVRQRGHKAGRRLHSWPFAQLRGFIAYKAQEDGCAVKGIDRGHTSPRCSHCGHTARANRRSQSDFTCQSCGCRRNADRNGSRNIAWKYLAGIATCLPAGSPSTGPVPADPGGQAVGLGRW